MWLCDAPSFRFRMATSLVPSALRLSIAKRTAEAPLVSIAMVILASGMGRIGRFPSSRRNPRLRRRRIYRVLFWREYFTRYVLCFCSCLIMTFRSPHLGPKFMPPCLCGISTHRRKELLTVAITILITTFTMAFEISNV